MHLSATDPLLRATPDVKATQGKLSYYRVIRQFLAWSERAGYRHLEDTEPITVAAYIETLHAC